MRHRRKGFKLGRSSSHRKAMMRNLASSLFLTEREETIDDSKAPTPGRVVTTLQKAKAVRPLVEKCITIARKALPHIDAAEEFDSGGLDRYADQEEYRQWRQSERWQKWAEARAPVVTAYRRAMTLLGNKDAVHLLFEEVAPRFRDRDGGYTRILRLSTPRLGDAGTQAILEFVGRNDRTTAKSERPAFDEEEAKEEKAGAVSDVESEEAEESAEPSAEEQAAEQPSAEESQAEAPESGGSEESNEPKNE